MIDYKERSVVLRNSNVRQHLLRKCKLLMQLEYKIKIMLDQWFYVCAVSSDAADYICVP